MERLPGSSVPFIFVGTLTGEHDGGRRLHGRVPERQVHGATPHLRAAACTDSRAEWTAAGDVAAGLCMSASSSRLSRSPVRRVCVALALAPAALAQEPIGKPLIHNFERADVVVGAAALGRRAGRARRHVLRQQRRRARVRRALVAADCAARRASTSGRSRSRPTAKARSTSGASGDFGRLEPDEIGQWRFVSLLPPEARSDPSFDQRFTAVIDALRRRLFQGHEQGVLLRAGLRCRSSETMRSPIFAARTRALRAAGQLSV